MVGIASTVPSVSCKMPLFFKLVEWKCAVIRHRSVQTVCWNCK